MTKLKDRYAAVLMSVSSLPGPYGIGSFGAECRRFLDYLHSMGFSAWQVLPFNPLDCGNSPYGSCSAFAGNYLYIDPVWLVEHGYLTEAERRKTEYTGSPYTVDYDFVARTKRKMLNLAFNRAVTSLSLELQKFARQNTWVEDYALFMVLKDIFGSAPWNTWPQEYRVYKSAASKIDRFYDRMLYYIFEQYVFMQQVQEMRSYAEGLSIAIIGDMPIYVAYDSVDVWKHPNLFYLNPDFSAEKIAGVPPDAFSADGQLWGNPLYDWPQHAVNGYTWWVTRLRRAFCLYDAVRIDHFRGFASYYAIPAGAKSAAEGAWEKGPGIALFDRLFSEFDRNRIIAEDLGSYGADVVELLHDCKIKGMRVLQFGFSGEDSPHLPHNYNTGCLAYLGTHDNNTLLGWLWDLDEAERQRALQYCGFVGENWGQGGYNSPSCRAMLETVWKSAAAGAVVAFQDLCGFGCDARMNIPGVAEQNWRFRATAESMSAVDMLYYYKINKLFFR